MSNVFRPYREEEIPAGRGVKVGIMFNSVAEVYQMKTPRLPSNQHFMTQGARVSSRDSMSWFGVQASTLDDIMKIVNGGWKEGMDKMAGMLDKIQLPKKVRATRRKKTRGPFGDELDIQSVYRGDLGRAWSRTVKQEVQRERRKKGGKKITLMVNVTENAGCSADAMLWKSATAYKVMEALIYLGYSVEVIAVAAARQASGHLQTAVVVKHFEQKPDMAYFAGTVGFPGFFRTVMFHSFAASTQKVDGHLGYAERMFLDFKHLKNRGATLIVETGITNATAAQQYVEKLVDQFI